MSEIDTTYTHHSPARTIIIIPLVLITAFCFSYVQYTSVGNKVSEVGHKVPLLPTASAEPLSVATQLTTSPSNLPLLTISVAAPEQNQSLTSQTTPVAAVSQLTAQVTQSLQDSTSSFVATQPASNLQHDQLKFKPQVLKINIIPKSHRL